MNVVAFKVNLTTAFTDAQLVKGGWQIVEKDKLYTRLKGKYRYNYIIKSFGKIRISEIKGQADYEGEFNYEALTEFNFEDAWKNLWNKSFTPESLEILTKENLVENLVENGWKPSVYGVIEYVIDEYNLSFYYPAPENQNLYKLVDDNPGDVLVFFQKLKDLNIA